MACGPCQEAAAGRLLIPATVTVASPLEVRISGDTTSTRITQTAVAGLVAGDRVLLARPDVAASWMVLARILAA